MQNNDSPEIRHPVRIILKGIILLPALWICNLLIDFTSWFVDKDEQMEADAPNFCYKRDKQHGWAEPRLHWLAALLALMPIWWFMKHGAPILVECSKMDEGHAR